MRSILLLFFLYYLNRYCTLARIRINASIFPIGNVRLSPHLLLEKVLFVPSFKYNLFYVRSLTKNAHFSLIFSIDSFELIRMCKKIGNLYYLLLHKSKVFQFLFIILNFHMMRSYVINAWKCTYVHVYSCSLVIIWVWYVINVLEYVTTVILQSHKVFWLIGSNAPSTPKMVSKPLQL